MTSYLIFLGTFIGIYALYSLGLNLQWGYTGLLNFGHVAFMTVGAYTTVLLNLQGVPSPIAALCGMVMAALLGLVMGLTTLRLREDYLAIVTIGGAEVIRLIATNEKWLTKGTQGLQGFDLPLQNWEPNVFARLGMIGLLTGAMIWVYWQLWRWTRHRLQHCQHNPRQHNYRQLVGQIVLSFSLAVLGLTLYCAEVQGLYYYTFVPKSGLLLLLILVSIVTFWSVEHLVRSPWGRVLKAVREDQEVARALGKNVFSYKLQSLMLGGAIAGLAGAFYAWQFASLYPDSFKPQTTFDAWTIVVLGGAANNLGPILGAVLFWGYDSLTRFGFAALQWGDARVGALRIMVIGLLLIGLMVWRPQGLLGNKDELTLER